MLARLLNKDGTLNIKPKGISIFKQKDFHYSIVTTNWLNFFLVITGFFFVINVLFTIVYLLLGSNEIAGIIHDDKVGYFWEVFFFSAQTITTVAYGRISPVGVAASSVAAIESMMGLILFAFATGLTYSRFSRPKTKINYSKIMLVGPYQNGLALMVRVVNYKKNQLVDLSAEIILTVNILVDGKRTRFFYDLPLEQQGMGMMMMSWTIVHKISDESPLNGLTQEDLEDSDAEILVIIKGSDDILLQNVFSRTSFRASKLVWNAQFINIDEFDEVGNLQIDISKMSDYIIIPSK